MVIAATLSSRMGQISELLRAHSRASTNDQQVEVVKRAPRLQHLDLRTGRFRPLRMWIITGTRAPGHLPRERFRPLTQSGHLAMQAVV